jgi:hypothetical protein
MGIIFRKVWRLGPLRLNFTNKGLSSRTRAHRVDLPGPISWKQDKR